MTWCYGDSFCISRFRYISDISQPLNTTDVNYSPIICIEVVSTIYPKIPVEFGFAVAGGGFAAHGEFDGAGGVGDLFVGVYGIWIVRLVAVAVAAGWQQAQA